MLENAKRKWRKKKKHRGEDGQDKEEGKQFEAEIDFSVNDKNLLVVSFNYFYTIHILE